MNVHSWIEVRPDGRTKLVSAEQFWNAQPPMLAKVDGRLRLESELHPLKAHAPMLVTPVGMVIDDRLRQP